MLRYFLLTHCMSYVQYVPIIQTFITCWNVYQIFLSHICSNVIFLTYEKHKIKVVFKDTQNFLVCSQKSNIHNLQEWVYICTLTGFLRYIFELKVTCKIWKEQNQCCNTFHCSTVWVMQVCMIVLYNTGWNTTHKQT